jgi:hypothetical protein
LKSFSNLLKKSDTTFIIGNSILRSVAVKNADTISRSFQGAQEAVLGNRREGRMKRKFYACPMSLAGDKMRFWQFRGRQNRYEFPEFFYVAHLLFWKTGRRAIKWIIRSSKAIYELSYRLL